MVVALVTHDFSVSYVAQVGSRATPLFYTVISLWGALEGSILFWAWVLAMYASVVVFVNRHRPGNLIPYTALALLAVSLFFGILLVGPANPFHPVFPVPADGPGPNPLLQNHILMGVHPPLLYLGYVGMTVPFAFAVGAMLSGEVTTDDWIRLSHRWTLLSWGFLSAGDHRRNVVVVRSARLGRLLGVGSGRERVVSAVADGDGVPAFGGHAGAARHAPALEPQPRRRHVRPHGARHVPHAVGHHLVGARVHRRRHRLLLPRVHRRGAHRGAGDGRWKLGTAAQRRTVRLRGLAGNRVPAQQPVSHGVHVHGARGNALPAGRRSGARREGQRGRRSSIA